MAKRVLIIDDTLVIRELLRDFFTEAGYEVETARDGREGYELAVKNDYSMVFCDVHMPEMNGVEMVTNLKQVKPDIPIVIMDSLPGKQARLAKERGALECLAKPFDLNELRRIIKLITEGGKTPVK